MLHYTTCFSVANYTEATLQLTVIALFYFAANLLDKIEIYMDLSRIYQRLMLSKKPVKLLNYKQKSFDI